MYPPPQSLAAGRHKIEGLWGGIHQMPGHFPNFHKICFGTGVNQDIQKLNLTV